MRRTEYESHDLTLSRRLAVLSRSDLRLSKQNSIRDLWRKVQTFKDDERFRPFEQASSASAGFDPETEPREGSMVDSRKFIFGK